MIPAAAQTDLVETYRPQLEGRPVLLYDGVCVICNRTVQFLLRHEREATLRFVPLQSLLGEQILALYGAQQATDPGKEGVVLITQALTPMAQFTRRTDAFAIVLRLLQSPWPIIAQLLRWTPRFMREPAYTLFARYRYRIFGRHEVCPLPTPEQRARILGIPA
jgi:predicted DCC family thiol-disulfide oxidoreductase YuxK